VADMRTIVRILVAIILLVCATVSSLHAGPREKVEQACRNYVISQLQWNPDDVEIEFRRYIEPAIDWAGVSLQINHPGNADLCGAVTLRVTATKNGETLRSFPVPIQVTLYDDVVTTTRRLRRHEVITAGDVSLERREVELKRDKPYVDLAKVIGYRVQRSLTAGRALTPSAIEEVPLVKRGQRVTVRYQSGNLLLTTIGEAIEDGWKGRPVRVKNLSSKRLITGIPVDLGLVDVLRASAGN